MEIWQILMSMEMDFLRRSARCSRLEKNRNNVIREKMNIKNSVLDYIRYKQLNWHDHVQIIIIIIKTYVDGNGLSEEIGQMFKIRKK